MSRAAFASFALAAVTVIVASSASAEVYRPWCAQYMSSSGDGATNCSFTSYEQCMMTARGAGAYCVQNPWYLQYGGDQGRSDSAGQAGRAGGTEIALCAMAERGFDRERLRSREAKVLDSRTYGELCSFFVQGGSH